MTTIPEGHKRCTKCKVVKLLTEFYLRDKDRHYRQSKCRPCHRAYMTAYHEAKRTTPKPPPLIPKGSLFDIGFREWTEYGYRLETTAPILHMERHRLEIAVLFYDEERTYRAGNEVLLTCPECLLVWRTHMTTYNRIDPMVLAEKLSGVAELEEWHSGQVE